MTHRKPGDGRAGSAALLAFGLVLCLLTALVRSGFGADDAHKINWRTDLGQAQAEAKARDRLLWIQFSGPWCVNCRRMERSAFVDQRILVESIERFIPVKLRSDEYENLTATLSLTMLPATVIVRPNGEVVDKFEGYADPDVFAAFLTSVLTVEGRTPRQVAMRATADQDKDHLVALAGYDPVSLLQNQKLVPGRVDLAVEHEGRTFRFVDEAGRDAFLLRPESFAPVNGGRCPVSQVDRGDFATGDPHWGVVYNGHLFLFKDVEDRARFAKDPERYAGLDPSVRTSCPHCRARAPLARRLTSRFSTLFDTRANHAAAQALPASPGMSHGLASTSLSQRLISFSSADSILRR